MKRNITLFTWIFSINQAWFWLGIWVPYYLRFTNYAGIGMIETVVVISAFLLELPTGAFADIFGKKKTLIISFTMAVIGNIVMAMAHSFSDILVSVLLLGIASALLSGTREAFLYDTLLTLKKQNLFESILARVTKYNLVIMAIASAVGGYMYIKSPGLPFWGIAVVQLLCLILVLFLYEPPIDTETFSLTTYYKQMVVGFRQLWIGKNEARWILKLIVISSFAKFLIEGLDPSLALHFGLHEKEMGFLYAIVPLVSALGAHLYSRLKNLLNPNQWWMLFSFSLILSSVLSPLFGLTIGVLSILYRNVFYAVLDIFPANVINSYVQSKYRATTLSSFNMLKSIPYVFGAAIVGKLIDSTSSSITAMYLGIIFLLITGILVFQDHISHHS